ncbi:MAG: rRNA maturation RNase YbeY [Patescibacteria group bacterium]
MIDINNFTKFAVDKRFFWGVAKKVLKGENEQLDNLSIAFVSSQEIKKLNKKYRNKNKPTDVLSFQKNTGLKEDFSEVIICPELVREKAAFLKTSLKRGLTRALIHGILHNLGYDHEVSKKEAEMMEKKEEYYLSKVK